MTGALLEEDWERLGLHVLSTDEDRTLILFSSTEDLSQFEERLARYGAGPAVGRVNAPYAGFVANIESVSAVQPADRIGRRLKEAGFNELGDFASEGELILDLDMWDIGGRQMRQRRLQEISRYVAELGGETLDEYIGASLSMLRLRLPRRAVPALLDLEEIAELDLPPVPDLETTTSLDLELGDLPALNPLSEDDPLVGVIDSGVNYHPLLDGAVVGSIGVPAEIGEADDFGHGTRVAGVVAFGDLRQQLAQGTLDRTARICSAKVVNERGQFDDKKLIATQMRDAIRMLNERFQCRLFVIALCDISSVYGGGKVGPWAATLDELARELDVLIVVSAGNRMPRSGLRVEEGVTEYPFYLFEPSNRLYEPAAAINVITIGSLAHGAGLDGNAINDVRVQAITEQYQPSPFSRVGPGVEGGIKPDFVDLGGTMIYDPVVGRLLDGSVAPSAGMLTLHFQSAQRLLTTGSGTSYAAPMVANKAASLLRLFPSASANLLRALLAIGSYVPPETMHALAAVREDEVRDVVGRGVVSAERAAFSDDNRVVLFADAELQADHFAVYEIPVPEPFQSESGTRQIRVSLAYDPPVRHTRAQYAGLSMNFRLFRGCDPNLLFDHYRRRNVETEGEIPTIENRYGCALKPGPQVRERSTLQSASVEFKRDVSRYGDRYHLVVRCENGWAGESVSTQRFAVVVELLHQAEVRLYERMRVRVRA